MNKPSVSKKIISEEALAKINGFNHKTDDWRAVCPTCHRTVRGTPEQIMKHRCVDGQASN